MPMPARYGKWEALSSGRGERDVPGLVRVTGPEDSGNGFHLHLLGRDPALARWLRGEGDSAAENYQAGLVLEQTLGREPGSGWAQLVDFGTWEDPETERTDVYAVYAGVGTNLQDVISRGIEADPICLRDVALGVVRALESLRRHDEARSHGAISPQVVILPTKASVDRGSGAPEYDYRGACIRGLYPGSGMMHQEGDTDARALGRLLFQFCRRRAELRLIGDLPDTKPLFLRDDVPQRVDRAWRDFVGGLIRGELDSLGLAEIRQRLEALPVAAGNRPLRGFVVIGAGALAFMILLALFYMKWGGAEVKWGGAEVERPLRERPPWWGPHLSRVVDSDSAKRVGDANPSEGAVAQVKKSVADWWKKEEPEAPPPDFPFAKGLGLLLAAPKVEVMFDGGLSNQVSVELARRSAASTHWSSIRSNWESRLAAFTPELRRSWEAAGTNALHGLVDREFTNSIAAAIRDRSPLGLDDWSRLFGQAGERVRKVTQDLKVRSASLTNADNDELAVLRAAVTTNGYAGFEEWHGRHQENQAIVDLATLHPALRDRWSGYDSNWTALLVDAKPYRKLWDSVQEDGSVTFPTNLFARSKRDQADALAKEASNQLVKLEKSLEELRKVLATEKGESARVLATVTNTLRRPKFESLQSLTNEWSRVYGLTQERKGEPGFSEVTNAVNRTDEAVKKLVQWSAETNFLEIASVRTWSNGPAAFLDLAQRHGMNWRTLSNDLGRAMGTKDWQKARSVLGGNPARELTSFFPSFQGWQNSQLEAIRGGEAASATDVANQEKIKNLIAEAGRETEALNRDLDTLAGNARAFTNWVSTNLANLKRLVPPSSASELDPKREEREKRGADLLGLGQAFTRQREECRTEIEMSRESLRTAATRGQALGMVGEALRISQRWAGQPDAVTLAVTADRVRDALVQLDSFESRTNYAGIAAEQGWPADEAEVFAKVKQHARGAADLENRVRRLLEEGKVGEAKKLQVPEEMNVTFPLLRRWLDGIPLVDEGKDIEWAQSELESLHAVLQPFGKRAFTGVLTDEKAGELGALADKTREALMRHPDWSSKWSGKYREVIEQLERRAPKYKHPKPQAAL